MRSAALSTVAGESSAMPSALLRPPHASGRMSVGCHRADAATAESVSDDCTVDADAPYPYSGPRALRASIDLALRKVVDPEFSLTIVDVGLVYAVAVTDKRVHVLITMTSAACPVTDVIVRDVEAELHKAVPAGLGVHLELTWDPPWDADRMSARAKAFMGW